MFPTEMQVFRLERDGFGPYVTDRKIDSVNSTVLFDIILEAEGFHDFLTENPGARFGCQTPEILSGWFDGDMPELLSRGFAVTSYWASEFLVGKSGTQVVFVPNKENR